ncbi:MAG: FAD-binding oxidoreductase [Candidatus Pacearchaeota archaeon]
MEHHIVKIIDIEKLNYNVKRFFVERPYNLIFTPGQAIDVAINKNGFEKKFRPFTPVNLPNEEHLEFIIKEYKRGGVTEEIHKLKNGDELIIGKVFGDIKYFGPGIFLAGGTGITPFYSIFRYLVEKRELDGNTLVFSNKTKNDIILEYELNAFKDFGLKILFMLTDEESKDYYFGKIDFNFLSEFIKDKNQKFYICGPPQFNSDIFNILIKLGISSNEIIM